MTEVFAEILADPAVATIGWALAVAAVALWVVAAWWAYSDAERRTESSLAALVAAGWVVLSTPLMLPLSLLIYTFARPQLTAADHRANALVRELAATGVEGTACAGCGMDVDPSWLRCPSCATWQASPCSACGSWSDPTLEICPWCGSEEREAPAVTPLTPAAASLVARGRRSGRAPLRPIGQAGPRIHHQPDRRLPVSPEGRLVGPVRLRRV